MAQPMPSDRYIDPMRQALEAATEAVSSGDVPVGALLLDATGAVVDCRSQSAGGTVRSHGACRDPGDFGSGTGDRATGA